MSTPSMSYCSVNTRTVSHESPIGSASGFQRNFLIEIQLPWTKQPLESVKVTEEIKAAIAAYREKMGDVTVTLLVPDPGYATVGARLIDIQVIDGQIHKRDLIAHDGDVAGIIHGLADGGDLPEHITIDHTLWRDIIVCTHGSRDACCGTFGVPIYQHLRQLTNDGGNVRVWRSSHLGGHRFAPTLTDYPSGRCWAFVNEEIAGAILTEGMLPEGLLENYRGWVGHREQALQMLEAEAFVHYGWQWAEFSQHGRILERDDEDRGIVAEIVATHPTLPTVKVTGRVEYGEEYSTFASCNAAPVTYQRRSLVEFEHTIMEPADAR